MLGLKLPTDPRWVSIVEKNIEEILTDHAYCEQKAASNAISLIVGWPEKSELVSELLLIAKEEIEHFDMVHKIIVSRGFTLGKERKDEYVNLIYKFIRKGHGRHIALIDRLLFAALIEARSCERFRLLSEQLKDQELAAFYRDLMISEAAHYKTFIMFARKYSEGEDVNKRWKDFLEYEGKIIRRFGVSETMHG